VLKVRSNREKQSCQVQMNCRRNVMDMISYKGNKILVSGIVVIIVAMVTGFVVLKYDEQDTDIIIGIDNGVNKVVDGIKLSNFDKKDIWQIGVCVYPYSKINNKMQKKDEIICPEGLDGVKYEYIDMNRRIRYYIPIQSLEIGEDGYDNFMNVLNNGVMFYGEEKSKLVYDKWLVKDIKVAKDIKTLGLPVNLKGKYIRLRMAKNMREDGTFEEKDRWYSRGICIPYDK